MTSESSAFCPNMNCYAKVVARLTNMLQKMNVKGFAESTIRSLGIMNFYDFMHIGYDFAASKLGMVNAKNLMECIEYIRIGNIPDFTLIGALGFTDCASSTWKSIFANISLVEFVDLMDNHSEQAVAFLTGIEGIGPKTAQTILREYPFFRQDIQYILDNTNYADSSQMFVGYRKQIRFSGVRDLQLAEQLCKLGYDANCQEGISKKTEILLIPYNGYESNKTKKVGPNCKLVPIDEVRQAVARISQQSQEDQVKFLETGIL